MEKEECRNGHRYAHYECVDCGHKIKEVEKGYCTCGKDANMGSNDTNYQCFTCCKPNYATWWAKEMNKK